MHFWTEEYPGAEMETKVHQSLEGLNVVEIGKENTGNKVIFFRIYLNINEVIN